MTTMELAWRVALYSGAIPLGLFIGYYLALSRWWATDVGRIIVGLAVSLELMMLLGLSRTLFGDWTGANLLRLILYSAVLAGLWHLFLTLRRIQRTRCDGTVAPPFPRSLFTRHRRKD